MRQVVTSISTLARTCGVMVLSPRAWCSVKHFIGDIPAALIALVQLYGLGLFWLAENLPRWIEEALHRGFVLYRNLTSR
jgi:hypothetical protein